MTSLFLGFVRNSHSCYYYASNSETLSGKKLLTDKVLVYNFFFFFLNHFKLTVYNIKYKNYPQLYNMNYEKLKKSKVEL